MSIIKLGNAKNTKNHIKVKDDSVSFDHLEMNWVDKNTLVIKDLNSTNKTKVNGIQIRKKAIAETDKIEVGFSVFTGEELIRLAKPFRYADRVLFYDEFIELRYLFDDYQRRIKKLKSVNKNKISTIKFIIPVSLLVVFIFFGEALNIPKELRYVVPIVGGAISTIFADKLFNQEDLKMQLQQLREEYHAKLICPKCTHVLISRSYNYWNKLRRCPKCHANWVK